PTAWPNTTSCSVSKKNLPKWPRIRAATQSTTCSSPAARLCRVVFLVKHATAIYCPGSVDRDHPVPVMVGKGRVVACPGTAKESRQPAGNQRGAACSQQCVAGRGSGP